MKRVGTGHFAAALLAILVSGETVAKEKLQAKISRAEASRIAAARVPGGKIESAELERENGRVVWSFDIRGKNPGIEEIQVDANSGEIVSEKHESARDEAAEKAADARKAKKK